PGGARLEPPRRRDRLQRRRRRVGARGAGEPGPPELRLAELRRIGRLPVAADVAVLGADHDENKIVVADVDDLARRLRFDVRHAARPELARLTGQAELCSTAVDEIEL